MQGNSTPYTNPAPAIPGTIEIEHFDNGGEGLAYHDTSTGSHGQDYEQPPSYPVPSFRQPTDVDIYHSLDYSNSYLIVMQQGDWMKYTVDIAQTGTYTLEGQTYYWDSQGGTFHVEVDGVDKTGQLRIPGGTNVWQMVTKTGVQLTAGRHVLKIVCDSNGSDGYYMGDIDFLRFIASSQTSAHWKLDEGSGTTAADSSGNGNAGTVSGAAWTPGKAGTGALSFNGTSDYVSVASNASLTGIVNNFTVSFWVNPNQSYPHEIDAEGTWGTSGVYNQRYLFGPSLYTDGTAGAGISIGSNGVSVYEHASNYMPATLVYQAPITGWTHVTLVYENKQPRLYINGSLVRTGLTSPMAAVHINPLNLGGFSYGYYAGQLDDVRIYGSVLSGTEIQSLITESDGGQTTYHASTDFSTTQGYRNWYYISDTSDTLMTYRSDYNVWEGAEGAYQWLWNNGGHPMNSHDAIRQWRAPSSGDIQISGSASDSNVGCGDGVNVSITKNGTPLWQRNIANGDSTGYSYNLSLTVAAGDKINFIINKGSGNSVECDSTTFDPTITFTASSGPDTGAHADFAMARLDPMNRTGTGGEDLLSGNYNWTLPLVSLPGRAGLDLGLALSYNSLVWTRTGQSITYDADHGFPSPGFRLGFPTIEPLFYNSQTGRSAYLLLMPSGSRVELRQNTSNSNIYESADSSYLQLDASQMILRTTDGTQLSYSIFKGGAYRCTQIKDRNGNLITVAYYGDETGRIDTIKDTLARTVTFNYDPNLNLQSITAQRKGQTAPWPVATFGYTNLTIQTNFSGLSVTGTVQNGTTIPVLTNVCLDDRTCNDFNYTSWGQVWRIDHYVENNVSPGNWILLNHVSYNLPATSSTQQTDCPRFTEKRVWAVGWNTDTDGVPAPLEEAVTAYSIALNGTEGRVMLPKVVYQNPDGSFNSEIRMMNKETFGSGWSKGLTLKAETFVNDQLARTNEMTWTQDDTSLAYQLNPRPLERKVSDPAGNIRGTIIDYGQYAQYGLPYEVSEYAGAQKTVLRRTRTFYNLSDPYKSRHMIGLLALREVYDGANNLFSKVEYLYDLNLSQEYLQDQGAAIQHDGSNYPASFVEGRGNLSRVVRWNVSQPTNQSLILESRVGYNTQGSVIFTRDPLGHQTNISYADSFSDAASHAQTFAYPTTVTDADGYVSRMKYDYYLGAVAEKTDPKSATVVTLYDAAGRVDRIYNTFNNAFQQFHYGPRYVVTFTSVKSLTEPVYAITWTDGLGQPYAMAQDAPVPGAAGARYSGQVLSYDVMGRVQVQSNPTEMEPGWIASGDDAAGWRYTWQTYDWKGRARVKINVDGTTMEATYGGCGCAGGESVETTDEVGRRQRATSDALGRVFKTELLNSNGTTYSTAVTTYNPLDQAMAVRQYQGTEGSGVYQETLMTYDGYGRLASRKLPQQTNATTYSYYADDLVQSVTDGRGATATYGYNGRHLPTAIFYRLAGSDDIDVSYGYDEAGNRTRMTDATGISEYHYDQLSRMDWEKRTVQGITGNNVLQIGYGYDLGGNLASITDPFNATVSYERDAVGRITAVNGSGFNEVLDTPGGQEVTQYASNFTYRAWGALKHLSYSNGLELNLTYNNRLKVRTYNVAPLTVSHGYEVKISHQYDYYADGRVSFISDLNNHEFDRSYSYDHVGRLSTANTSYVARGEQMGPLGPYQQSYQYDTFDHMTSRSSQHWSRSFSYSTSYLNNRDQKPGVQYDAQGNIIVDSSQKQHGYNAAGDKVLVVDSTGKSVVQGYDGDHQQVKRVETLTDPSSTTASYLLRSSVLGGAVLTELYDNGAKQKTSVYAGTQVIATQNVSKELNASGQITQAVVWHHEAPVTGNERNSAKNKITAGEWTQLDPLGVDAWYYNKYADIEEPERDWPRNLHGTMSDPSGGCAVDGVSAPCGYVLGLLNNGSAELCPNNDCGAQVVVDGNGRRHIAPLGHNPRTGRLGYSYWVNDEGTERHDGDRGDVVIVNRNENALGHWEFAAAPDSGKAPLRWDQSLIYNFLKTVAKHTLNSSACKDFLIRKGLIFQDIDHALDLQKPYDGTRSTIDVVQAGLMSATGTYKDTKVKVNAFVRVWVDHAAAAFRTIPTRYDVYLVPNNYNSLDLIHEALHSATLLDDVDLAHKLTGNNYDEKNIRNASADITDSLAKNGCGDNVRAR